MVTTAFLIKVIIYGLIAAVIIPAIDFIVVVFRESRRSSSSPYDRISEVREWNSLPERRPRQVTREAPAAQPSRQGQSSPEARSTPTSRERQTTPYTHSTLSSRSGLNRHDTQASMQDRQRLTAYATGGPTQGDGVGRRNPASDGIHTDSLVPVARSYVASNGVTITPNLVAYHGGRAHVARPAEPLAASPNHPHAEYWSYGNARFYEHR